jgi:hypothetical protein
MESTARTAPVVSLLVDAVEKALERAGHVADVRGCAGQIAIGLKCVGDGRGERGPKPDLDPLDLIGARQPVYADTSLGPCAPPVPQRRISAVCFSSL